MDPESERICRYADYERLREENERLKAANLQLEKDKAKLEDENLKLKACKMYENREYHEKQISALLKENLLLQEKNKVEVEAVRAVHILQQHSKHCANLFEQFREQNKLKRDEAGKLYSNAQMEEGAGFVAYLIRNPEKMYQFKTSFGLIERTIYYLEENPSLGSMDLLHELRAFVTGSPPNIVPAKPVAVTDIQAAFNAWEETKGRDDLPINCDEHFQILSEQPNADALIARYTEGAWKKLCVKYDMEVQLPCGNRCRLTKRVKQAPPTKQASPTLDQACPFSALHDFTADSQGNTDDEGGPHGEIMGGLFDGFGAD